MAQITLKNSKTRRVEPLEPTIIPDTVSMYLCGPTVYDRAHIGNARSAVAFDVLYRLLRHEYGPENVTFVRNFTDVDDKINARASELAEAGDHRPMEAIIAEITAETAQWYLDDMGALGVLEPTHMPRATAYIPQMVAFIEDLIAKGFAYAKDGHVLFRVRAFKDYGKLSGRSVDDMIAGARVEVAPYKEDPMDFVLWKPSSDDIPGWESPWGRGRPGWHIECSAMSHAILGEAFDIHGGGSDLLFPHHENEVAQSCAAGHAFARIWMHNEMLQVEGKKMSKSLGNFFTVRDLLDQGVPGEVIRMVFLGTHYGKPMDWTERKREEAEKTLRRWRNLTMNAQAAQPDPTVVEALADDLNTAAALSLLFNLESTGQTDVLVGSAKLLGLLTDDLSDWDWRKREVSQGAVQFVGTGNNAAMDVAVRVATKWHELREKKDFQAADSLRAAAANAGLELRAVSGAVQAISEGPLDTESLEDL